MNGEYLLTLDEHTISEYFTERRDESSTLEFKHGGVDIEKLYKEICAFANTDGGTLILGSPKEQETNNKGNKSNYCQGEIVPSKLKMSEDDLHSSISSNISPMPHGIKIKRIILENGNVYIINVPKSIKKPHQYKGTYYIRVNTKSEPAPHGIVEMMFNQKVEVDLDLTVSTSKISDKENTIDIHFRLKNNTNTPAQKVELFISIVGHVLQIVDPEADKNSIEEYKLLRNRLTEGRHEFTKLCNFPHAIVDKLMSWYTAMDIRIRTEYCYIKAIYWAEGVSAKVNYYKVYKDVSKPAELLDFSIENPEKQEYLDWSLEKIVE